jgi:hypothetical protein
MRFAHLRQCARLVHPLIVRSGRDRHAVGDFCFDEIGATRQAVDEGAQAVKLIDRQQAWSVGERSASAARLK